MGDSLTRYNCLLLQWPKPRNIGRVLQSENTVDKKKVGFCYTIPRGNNHILKQLENENVFFMD
jgi:hypothetical protein